MSKSQIICVCFLRKCATITKLQHQPRLSVEIIICVCYNCPLVEPSPTRLCLVGIGFERSHKLSLFQKGFFHLQSGSSYLAKHGGAYFSVVYGSIKDPIVAPGLFEPQECQIKLGILSRRIRILLITQVCSYDFSNDVHPKIVALVAFFFTFSTVRFHICCLKWLL